MRSPWPCRRQSPATRSFQTSAGKPRLPPRILSRSCSTPSWERSRGAIIMRHGASWQALAGSARPGPAGSDLHGELGAAKSDVRLRGCRGLCARQHHGPRFHIVDDVAAGSGGLSPADAGSTRRSAMGAAGVGANRCGESFHWRRQGRAAGLGSRLRRHDRGCIVRRHGPHPRRYVFPLAAALCLLARCTGAGLGWSRNRSGGRFQRPQDNPASRPSRPARTTWAALRQAG